MTVAGSSLRTELSFAAGGLVEAALSLPGSGVSVSGVDDEVVSAVDELTDSGGGTSRILDGEEGTDFGRVACCVRLYWAADVGSVAGSQVVLKRRAPREAGLGV